MMMMMMLGVEPKKRLSGPVFTGNVQNTQDPNPTKTRAPTNIIYIARPGLGPHPYSVANRSPSTAHRRSGLSTRGDLNSTSLDTRGHYKDISYSSRRFL